MTASQEKINSAIANIPAESSPFRLIRALQVLVYHALFPVSAPIVLACEGWPTFHMMFASVAHSLPLAALNLVAPCLALVAFVLYFVLDDGTASGSLSSTELALAVGYFLASCGLVGAKYGFTAPEIAKMQNHGPSYISTALSSRMSVVCSWLTPPVEILRHEARLACQRLGMELSAHWMIARQSMMPAVLAMLEPSICHALQLQQAEVDGKVVATFVDEDCTAPNSPDSASSEHGPGSAAAAHGKQTGTMRPFNVDTTNPMVESQGPSRQSSMNNVSVSRSDSGVLSPRARGLHCTASSVKGVYSILGKEVIFSLEAFVVSCAARSQPAGVGFMLRAAGVAAAAASAVPYIVFFANGGTMNISVGVIAARVLLFLLATLAHWSLLVFLVVATVDYRRRRLMAATLSSVLQRPCFGTPSALLASREAEDQAVESSVQSGSVRSMLATSGLPAFNPFNVGAAPPRPSQARASLAQQATDHLLSLPEEQRRAIKEEIRVFVYPSLPLVDLSRPENAIAWVRARSIVSDFGGPAFVRIQLALTILGICTLWLLIASLSSFFTHEVGFGESIGQDALYASCIVNFFAMVCTLVTCMADGAYSNNDLAWQADRLGKTAISASQLAHSLRVLHNITPDGKVLQGGGSRSGTFARAKSPKTSQASLAHMEGAVDSSGNSAQMHLAQGSALHLWRETFASTLLARIARIISYSADGRTLLGQLGVKGQSHADPVDMVLQQECTVRLPQASVLRLLLALPSSAVRALLVDLADSQMSLVAVRDTLSLHVRTHPLRILGLPATDVSAGYTLAALACFGSVILHAAASL